MTKPTVASLYWPPLGELHEFQGEAVEDAGYPHRFFQFDEPIPDGTGIVLVQGPYGSLLPLARQLYARRFEDRPVLVYWFQQSLRFFRPDWLYRWVGRVFSELCRYHDDAGLGGQMLHRLIPGFLDRRGTRYAFIGDILWLHQQGMLDVLATSASTYASYFGRLGIQALVVNRGYYPGYGELLDVERDIAVVWMGKYRTSRRRRIIYWLKDELEKRGHVMHIYDGVQNAFIFGEKRTQILNRAWFVLNVHCWTPKDELSIRYFVTAPTGAVILREPNANEYPFMPGKHLVECEIEEMPDKVMYYLAHPEEWQAISDEMLRFMQTELTLERSVSQMLEPAARILDAR